jgi:hypothetical protein
MSNESDGAIGSIRPGEFWMKDGWVNSLRGVLVTDSSFTSTSGLTSTSGVIRSDMLFDTQRA